MRQETLPPKNLPQDKGQATESTRTWRLRDRIGTYLSRYSLRTKLALGIALPLILILATLSANHFIRERGLLQAQVQLAAEQLAAVTLGSLRHAMLVNDGEMLVQTLGDIERLDNLNQVQIIDNQGFVWASSNPQANGAQHDISESECEGCHQAGNPLGALTTALLGQDGVLRTALPIPNDPACANCHTEAGSHLGVLLVDSSLRDIEQQLQAGLRQDLLFTGGTIVLIALAFALMIHWQVTRRVEAFRQPLAAYAAGDFSVRLTGQSIQNDELGMLATAFNNLAERLQGQKEDEVRQRNLREQMIIEERERIARELHDGLSQLLGYVNTKAAAVRLFLKNRQVEAAETQLAQLEAAASEMSIETREAILGLKLAGASNAGLIANLRDYVAQFCKLSDLEVVLDISPEVERRTIPLATELQLQRIVQEALTNVRKHALADQVWVHLVMDGECLNLEIRDNGVGFSPDPVQGNGLDQFGLNIMKERAEAIGADFGLESKPGFGTKITVSLETLEG